MDTIIKWIQDNITKISGFVSSIFNLSFFNTLPNLMNGLLNWLIMNTHRFVNWMANVISQAIDLVSMTSIQQGIKSGTDFVGGIVNPIVGGVGNVLNLNLNINGNVSTNDIVNQIRSEIDRWW